jgi:DNA-binding LytR/AlgR family response regulator
VRPQPAAGNDFARRANLRPRGRPNLPPTSAIACSSRRSEVIGDVNFARHTCWQSATNALARVAIKSNGTILFIDPAEIASVEAEGNYVLLQQRSGSYLLRESISVTSEKLAPYGFVRIHRSVLVNKAFVEEIQPWNTGEYILRIRRGKEYTLTRTYKKNMKSLARLWIGMD